MFVQEEHPESVSLRFHACGIGFSGFQRGTLWHGICCSYVVDVNISNVPMFF